MKKEYDYIIVVIAPVSLVSYILIVAKNANTFTKVARVNQLDERMLIIPTILYKENKLANMTFILNDIEIAKDCGCYGCGNYECGHTEIKKPWYKTLIKINKKRRRKPFFLYTY